MNANRNARNLLFARFDKAIKTLNGFYNVSSFCSADYWIFKQFNLNDCHWKDASINSWDLSRRPYFKIYWFFKKRCWGNYYSFSLTTLPPMHVAWGTTPLEVGHSPLETWVAWKTSTLPSGNKSLTVSTLEWCWKTLSKWHGVEHKAQAHLLSFLGRRSHQATEIQI